MGRTIKFKAKRLGNGEWVEGDLVHYNSNKIGIQYYTKLPNDDYVQVIHAIDPSTVCQFTGLKDKYGNPIFGGDILAHNHSVIGYIVDGVRGYCYDVIYTNPKFREKSWSLYGVVVDDYNGDVEVIGNKFDREKGEK